jgi:hypothetical protein
MAMEMEMEMAMETVHKSPAKDLTSIPQFVAPLDAFCDKKQLLLLPQFQRPQQEQPLPSIPSTDLQASSHSLPATACEMEPWQTATSKNQKRKTRRNFYKCIKEVLIN